jgi:hypothetical protein
VADPKDKIIGQTGLWYSEDASTVRQVSPTYPLPVTGAASTASIGSISTVSLVQTTALVQTVSLVTAVTSITNPVTVTASVTSTFTTSQVSVTTSATALWALNASPTFREVVNLSSSIVYIGTGAVATTSGHAVVGGTAFSMQSNTGAMSAVVTSGTATVTLIGW